MKKVFAFVAAIALFAGIANAQLGVNVGYAPQTYTTTVTINGNSGTTTSNMTGIFAGVNYNVNLTGDLNVSLGVQYRLNSSSDESTLLGVTTKTSDNQNLVDVPILFNYGLNLSDDLKLSLFVGPTISYALSGTHTVNVSGTVGGLLDGETKTDWYGDNSNRKAFDLAGTVGVNVQYHNVRLFGGYNMGLLNLTKADNTTLKGSNWFIGLGYCL